MSAESFALEAVAHLCLGCEIVCWLLGGAFVVSTIGGWVLEERHARRVEAILGVKVPRWWRR